MILTPQHYVLAPANSPLIRNNVIMEESLMHLSKLLLLGTVVRVCGHRHAFLHWWMHGVWSHLTCVTAFARMSFCTVGYQLYAAVLRRLVKKTLHWKYQEVKNSRGLGHEKSSWKSVLSPGASAGVVLMLPRPFDVGHWSPHTDMFPQAHVSTSQRFASPY